MIGKVCGSTINVAFPLPTKGTFFLISFCFSTARLSSFVRFLTSLGGTNLTKKVRKLAPDFHVSRDRWRAALSTPLLRIS